MGLGKAIKKKAKKLRQWWNKPGIASKVANTKVGSIIGKGASAVKNAAGLAAKQPLFWSGLNVAGDRATEELLDDDNMLKDYLQTAFRVGAVHQALKGGYKRKAKKKSPSSSEEMMEKYASQKAWDKTLGKYLLGGAAATAIKAGVGGDLAKETKEYLIDSPEAVALEMAMNGNPANREQNMQERIRRMAEKGRELYSDIGGRKARQYISKNIGDVVPIMRERNGKGKIIDDDTNEMKFAQQVYGLVGDPNKPRLFKDIDFDYDNLTPAHKEMVNAILSNMTDAQLDILGNNAKETQPKMYQKLKENGWLGENI